MESFTEIKSKERGPTFWGGFGSEGKISLVLDLVFAISLIYAREVPTGKQNI